MSPTTRLAALFETRGLSARSLALELGIPVALLGRVARGEQTLRPVLLERLAARLQKSPTEILHCLIPTAREGKIQSQDLQARRERDLAEAPTQVAGIEAVAEISAQGDLRLERRYLGCVPGPGRERGELVLKLRAIGTEASRSEPAFGIAPGAAPVNIDTEIDGAWRLHRLSFPRIEGGIAVRIVDHIEGCYRAEGVHPMAAVFTGWAAFSFYLPHLVNRLTIFVSMPETPQKWALRYWPKSRAMAANDRVLDRSGPCIDCALDGTGNTARAVIEGPVVGYTYAIAWLPS